MSGTREGAAGSRRGKGNHPDGRTRMGSLSAGDRPSLRALLTRLVAALAVILGLLIIVAIVGIIFTAQAYRDAGQQAIARQRVADNVLVTLLNAQTTNRGYVVTGRGDFLNAYTTARDEYPDQLAQLRRSVGTDEDLQEAVTDVDSAAIAYFEEARTLISLRRQDRVEAATTRVNEGTDESAFSGVRRAQRRLQSRIEQSRVETNRSLDRRAGATLALIVLAAVLSLVMVAFGSRQLWRRVGGPIGLVTAGVRRVAAGDLSRPVKTGETAVLEVAELSDGFNTMQSEVVAQRQAAAASARRVAIQQAERRLWETVQSGLLPESLPSVQGLNVAVRYQPAERALLVGGDFYDAERLPDGRLAIMVGDISGHGATAAAQAAALRFGWRTLVSVNPNPAAVIPALNAQMAARDLRSQGMFASLIYGLVERSGRVSFARAGHPAPFLSTQTGCRQLQPDGTGPLLGVLDEADWPVTTTRIPPGGTIYLFSDGLIEARRGADVFGVDRACQVLESERQSALEIRLKRLVERARLHEDESLRDDVVVLGVQRGPHY